MFPGSMVSNYEYEKYKKNCEEYNQIIDMFKILGEGKLSRKDVLDNIKNMIKNGLVKKVEDLVNDIEYYENRY